jgi:2-hydroxy-3-oxopropionate reductase
MRIVMEDAGKLGLALPAAGFAAQQMNAAVGAGDGEMDSSIIYKVLERMTSK